MAIFQPDGRGLAFVGHLPIIGCSLFERFSRTRLLTGGFWAIMSSSWAPGGRARARASHAVHLVFTTAFRGREWVLPWVSDGAQAGSGTEVPTALAP